MVMFEATVDNPFVVFAAKNIMRDAESSGHVRAFFETQERIGQLTKWVAQNFRLFNNNFYVETGSQTLLKDINKTAEVIVERLRIDLEIEDDK